MKSSLQYEVGQPERVPQLVGQRRVDRTAVEDVDGGPVVGHEHDLQVRVLAGELDGRSRLHRPGELPRARPDELAAGHPRGGRRDRADDEHDRVARRQVHDLGLAGVGGRLVRVLHGGHEGLHGVAVLRA